MPIGTPTGRTHDFVLTRDQMITLAHKIIGVLETGQVLDGDQLQDGILFLNMLVRETDDSGKWRWTSDELHHLPLVANTILYTAENGLPENIAELHSVAYRNAAGQDSAPLTILKAETYEQLANKVLVGDPRAIYLTENSVLAERRLTVYGMLTAIATQSTVEGFRCIRAHTSSLSNQPGALAVNSPTYWQPDEAATGTWAEGVAYTAPNLLRLLYRRPIYDFDHADDTPDLPISWPRLMVFKLAFDLGDIYGIPVEERTLMIQKAKGSFDDVFPSTKAKSNNLHNKVKFY